MYDMLWMYVALLPEKSVRVAGITTGLAKLFAWNGVQFSSPLAAFGCTTRYCAWSCGWSRCGCCEGCNGPRNVNIRCPGAIDYLTHNNAAFPSHLVSICNASCAGVKLRSIYPAAFEILNLSNRQTEKFHSWAPHSTSEDAWTAALRSNVRLARFMVHFIYGGLSQDWCKKWNSLF